eukprot:TRINITY_DN19897_c0_g1_i1.p1 TRINITY_DN19897_c0_g1~~TRINITY_DN19897_c0_g1_i1.p1  ORF type:complete len:283 (+),score=32.95 TRINITY_DN19897_c0_g1_i1:98-850(+)
MENLDSSEDSLHSSLSSMDSLENLRHDIVDDLDFLDEYEEFRELKEIQSIIENENVILHWKDEYNVGIPCLDKQHRQFFILIGTIRTLVKKGPSQKSRKMIKLILNELINHTVVHFGLEEKILLESGFPGALQHSKSHRVFAKEMSARLLEFNLTDKDVVNEELVKYLEKWLVNHILLEDFEHCQYTKNQLIVQKDNDKLKNVLQTGPPRMALEFRLNELIEKRRKEEAETVEVKTKRSVFLQCFFCGKI